MKRHIGRGRERLSGHYHCSSEMDYSSEDEVEKSPSEVEKSFTKVDKPLTKVDKTLTSVTNAL